MSFRKNIAKDLSMRFRARADLGSTFERHSEQWRSECRNIPVTLRMAELIVGSYEIDWATAEGIDSAANTMNTSAQKVKEALHIAREAPSMNKDAGMSLSPSWLVHGTLIWHALVVR